MNNQRTIFSHVAPFHLGFGTDLNAVTGLMINQIVDPNMDAIVTVAYKCKTKATGDASSNYKVNIGHSATSGANDSTIASGVACTTGTIAMATNTVVVPAGQYLTATLTTTGGTAASSAGIIGWLYISSISFPA